MISLVWESKKSTSLKQRVEWWLLGSEEEGNGKATVKGYQVLIIEDK